MAVQARVNFIAQQRLDLNHILAQESFLAYDFRSLLTGFSGLSKPYILRGYEVVGKTGLTLSVKVADALVFNPLDNNGSFLLGDPNDEQVLVDLPADQENIFVQARFVNQTTAPVNTAFWDSLALTGEDVAGTEFTASTNTQNIIVIQIEANTVGFDEDAIPILRASTSASAVTRMIDARQMLFRLGTGGPTPNPLNKFPWSNTRQESIAEGTGVGDDVDVVLHPRRHRRGIVGSEAPPLLARRHLHHVGSPRRVDLAGGIAEETGHLRHELQDRRGVHERLHRLLRPQVDGVDGREQELAQRVVRHRMACDGAVVEARIR